MGTIIGAAVGAATVIIFGKWLKGRDFIGLAAAFFILALAFNGHLLGRTSPLS